MRPRQPVALDHGRGRSGERCLPLGLAGTGARQQPSTRHGRERHGDLQLRIVIAAGLREGVGPGVVEHVFALAVRLEISGRAPGNGAALVLQYQMPRRPARASADRAGAFERSEEGMGDERIEQRRIGIGARIPVRGCHVGDARHDLDACLGCRRFGGWQRLWSHSLPASTRGPHPRPSSNVAHAAGLVWRRAQLRRINPCNGAIRCAIAPFASPFHAPSPRSVSARGFGRVPRAAGR